MGGNLINYPDDVGTPTANLLQSRYFSTALSQRQEPDLQVQTSPISI
jgi:hypothetical protein